MAQYTVNIFIDSLSPSALTVHPGDSVIFQLKRTDDVTVEFSTTPFAQSIIPLGHTGALSSQSTDAVLSTASGVYEFSVLPDSRDPAGTLKGKLDVTPDW